MSGQRRVVVTCGSCAWSYSYPADVPLRELLCPNPRDHGPRQPMSRGDEVVAVVQSDDPDAAEMLRAVLNDGNRTAV